jgi:hypothetical protein
MKTMENEKYLPKERREEILRSRYSGYQEQIVSCELSNQMLKAALQGGTETKLGKLEEDQIREAITQNERSIRSSYRALKLIAETIDILPKE